MKRQSPTYLRPLTGHPGTLIGPANEVWVKGRAGDYVRAAVDGHLARLRDATGKWGWRAAPPRTRRAEALPGATVLRPVPGYDGVYASDQGDILTDDNHGGLRLRRACPSAGYYPAVSVRANGRIRTVRVHLLVLLAFHGARPEGQQARHLNSVRGDNREANLAWGDGYQQEADKRANGTSNIGVRNGSAKLNDEAVRDIRRRVGAGERQVVLARQYSVCESTLSEVVTGKKWRHVQMGNEILSAT